MSDNWDADARVGVPMMQMIAKQVSQHKHSPREVRRIIDAQWLDEESKEQLRETFRVTDADLAAAEREAADQARRLTRERYGAPMPAGPCDCDAEFLVHPSGRIECQSCGAEWAAEEVRKVIDAQWLDEELKQQLRETFRVTDADLAAAEREAAQEREAADGGDGAAQGAAADEHEPADGSEPANGAEPASDREAAKPPEGAAGAQARNGREAARSPSAANGRGAARKRGKAGKREPGQREAAAQREPAKPREVAGTAEAAE